MHFPAKRLPDLIAATGDMRLVYWLIEKFLEPEEAKQQRAVQTIMLIAPQLKAALATLEKGKRR